MIKRQKNVGAPVDDLDQSEIYIVREGESIGPFTRQELLDGGAVKPNELIKIGAEGKPFPAAFMMQRTA